MAVGALRVSVVLAIGLCLGPAAASAVATLVKEISLSLQLKDPQDVTAARGQPATLQCEAEASGPVSWSWLFQGTPIAANDSRRQVRPDGALFIPAMQKRLRGTYQCLARNEVGAVLSNNATLRLASFGGFLEQPGNTSAAELQPVVLACKVASVPEAVVWWERDGKPLPLSTRYVPLPSGALLITSTQSSDAGLYRCLTTNKIFPKKIKRSNIGQLTVLPPPKSTEPLQFLPLELEPNVTVIAGINLTLFCTVTGWPAPNTHWLFNRSVVLGNSSTLQLHNVSGAATGDYSCIASNSEQQIVQDYFVQVYEPPRFNVTPTSISYPSARTVRLDCQAQGNPQPKIKWLMNGQSLTLVGRYIEKPNGLVLIHSFTTDVGIYQCVAENAAGTTWVAAQLVPYAAENRPNPPRGVQCRPFDDNSVCLVWKAPADSGVIQAYSIYGYTTDPTSNQNSHDYVTNGTYILADGLTSGTNYTFYVRSYSKDASDQSNNVSCQTGLKGDRNLHIEYLSENSVKLTWSNVSTDHPCSTTKAMYRVQWKRADQSSVNMEDPTLKFHKVVTGLRTSVSYEFRVISTTNKNDNSSWKPYVSREKSSEVASTTQGNNISELLMPQQLEVERLTPYSVNLTWLGLKNDKLFYVCYVEVNEDKNCEKGQLIKSEKNQMMIKNLKPNTLYEFKVRAESFKGLFSPFSHSVQVRTAVDIPSAVQDLKYRIVNDTTVCVRWRAPLRKNGKLTKYVVSYTPDKNWPLDRWYSLDVNMSNKYIKYCLPIEEDAIFVLLTKLDPDSHYTVIVRAATDAGLGNLTLPLSFVTRGTSASNYYPNLEADVAQPFDNQEDLYYKQKLGVALGISISLLCIVCCVSCIIFRRRCLKREALARARLAASGNYYTANSGAPYPSTSLQVRHQESCAAEAHEMQHLVAEERAVQIPAVTPPHLDTKGGVGFPNGQLNGTLKQHVNGHMANGHVHITENPRYDYHECNGHINTKVPKQDPILPLVRSKELKRSEDVPLENGKLRKPDYNWNCNSGEMCKISSSDDDLNATQLTCLDDSFKSHRRISPALGPNG